MIDVLAFPVGLPDFCTGNFVSRESIRPVETHIESTVSRTPSVYDVQELITLSHATGRLYLKEDPAYVVEKAHRYMSIIARSLPTSERANAEADALANQVRRQNTITPLTRSMKRD